MSQIPYHGLADRIAAAADKRRAAASTSRASIVVAMAIQDAAAAP